MVCCCWKGWKSLPTSLFEMYLLSVWNSLIRFVSEEPFATLTTSRLSQCKPRIQHNHGWENMDSLHRRTEPSGANSYKTFYPFSSLQGGWINASVKAYQCHFITDWYQNDFKVQAEEQALGTYGDSKLQTRDLKTRPQWVKWLWAVVCSGAHTENRPVGVVNEVGHSESSQTAKNN